jgi:hypothetical protein
MKTEKIISSLGQPFGWSPSPVNIIPENIYSIKTLNML